MKRIFFTLSLVLGFAVLFLSGCSGDYSAEALAKARSFALEHTRGVPEIARSHIRYTPPQVQCEQIFGHQKMTPTDYAHLVRTAGKKGNPEKDYMVINFVWTFPGADYHIAVLGRGLRDFSHWEGVRVILKKAAPRRDAYEDARKQAVGYAVNNMLELSRKEQNRIRFSEAEVLQTQFDLEHLSVPFHSKGGPDSWKDYLTRLKAERERFQYSLVWKADGNDRWIVFPGFGLFQEDDPYQEKALSAWKISGGMVISGTQLKKYTIRKVDTYAQNGVEITDLNEAEKTGKKTLKTEDKK